MIKLISEVEQEYEQAQKEDKTEVKLESKSFDLPVYQTAVYPNLYKEEKWYRFFGSKLVNAVLSLGTRRRLINALLEEVYPQNNVLQMGISFDDEIESVADQIGSKGRLDIIDVNNSQISFSRERYGYRYPNLHFYHLNAEEPLPKKYDVVICYMLLHELPIASKIRVVNNALQSITENGKVIFIDYGRPATLHPLAYIVRMFNRLYQPFAEKLWDREIASFADHDLEYNWKKQRFLGGLYQRVVVTRKNKDYLY